MQIAVKVDINFWYRKLLGYKETKTKTSSVACKSISETKSGEFRRFGLKCGSVGGEGGGRSTKLGVKEANQTAYVKDKCGGKSTKLGVIRATTACAQKKTHVANPRKSGERTVLRMWNPTAFDTPFVRLKGQDTKEETQYGVISVKAGQDTSIQPVSCFV